MVHLQLSLHHGNSIVGQVVHWQLNYKEASNWWLYQYRIFVELWPEIMTLTCAKDVSQKKGTNSTCFEFFSNH
jgi:hypothetical protein